jgi:hypothetical protein
LRGTMKERGSTVLVVSLSTRAVSQRRTERPRLGTRQQPLHGVVLRYSEMGKMKGASSTIS